MKRYFLYLLFSMLAVAGATAQKLTVEQLAAAGNDISASQHRRNDLNGQPCALVKVQLATAGAKFEGNVVGDVRYDAGEYWVYLSAGSKELRIKGNGFVACHVRFADYGIATVQSLQTYNLTLLLPQGGAVPVDDGLRYLQLTVEPATASVFIDNQPQQLTDGAANILLQQGTHSYRIEASGYQTETGTVQIGDETAFKTIRLRSTQAQVTVSCPTPGAQIFVNNQLRGSSPWSGQLFPGNYAFEARLDGYRTQRQTIALQQSEQRTVNLPALVAITGNLNVNYLPGGAEVWLDGSKLGMAPNIFRNITVGSHSVEVRKAGYETAKKTVTIAEGQTAQLSGTLTAAATQTDSSSSTNGASVETFTVNGVSFNMVRVDGGTFQMGATSEQQNPDSDEKPVRQVTLSSYYIGESEVTQALWEAVMGSNPSRFKGSNKPVEQVSWNACQEFVQKLSQLTGRKFRLPTEAEWEFAARGGRKSRGYQYSGSNRIDDVAVYEENSYKKGSSSPDYGTHNVKTKQANELGIYDMSGNVWEWCQDWKGSYGSSSQTNPTGPATGSYRVYRGGCWNYSAGICRVALRSSFAPGIRDSHLGLRLALQLSLATKKFENAGKNRVHLLSASLDVANKHQ